MEFQKNTFEIYWHLVKLGQNSRVMFKNHGALFLQYHRTNKIVFEKKKSGYSSGPLCSKPPHESSNWLLDPLSKIKINLRTLAIDYKKILKKKLTYSSITATRTFGRRSIWHTITATRIEAEQLGTNPIILEILEKIMSVYY